MTHFIAVVFILAGVSSIGMSEECNPDGLHKCFDGIKLSLINRLADLKNANQNDYCQFMENEAKCMKEASEACKEKEPKLSKLVSALYSYLNHMCSENAEAFVEVTPCLIEHQAEFDKCGKDAKVDHDDPLDALCSSVHGMHCSATLGRKLCKNGEAFAQALEARIKVFESDVCSGGSRPGHSYWILVLVILVVIARRNKF